MMNTLVAVQAKAQELLERGAGLYEAGKLYEALACWKRVLEIDPGNDIATEYLRFIEDNFQIGVDAFLAHHESASAPPHSIGPPAVAHAAEVPDAEPLGDLDWSELLDDPDAGAMPPPETSLVAAAEDDDEDFFAELEPGSMEAEPSEAADAWGASEASASVVNESLAGESLSADPFQLPASAFAGPFDPLAPPPLPGSGLHGTDPPLPLTDFGRARGRTTPPGGRLPSDRPRGAMAQATSADAGPFDFDGAADWPDIDSAALLDPVASVGPASSGSASGRTVGDGALARPESARPGGQPPVWSERGSDASLPFVMGDMVPGSARGGASGTGGLPSTQAAPTPPMGLHTVPGPLAEAPTPVVSVSARVQPLPMPQQAAPSQQAPPRPAPPRPAPTPPAPTPPAPTPAGAHPAGPPPAGPPPAGPLQPPPPPDPRGDRELTVMSDDSIELMLDNDFKAWETDGLEAVDAASRPPRPAALPSSPPPAAPVARGAAASAPPTARAAHSTPAAAGGGARGAATSASGGGAVDIFSSPFEQATPPPRPGPVGDDLDDWASLMGPAGSEQPIAVAPADSQGEGDLETEFTGLTDLGNLAPDPLPFDSAATGDDRNSSYDDGFDFDAAFEALEAGTSPPPVTLPDAATRARAPEPSALEASRAEAAARAAEDAARIAKAEEAVRAARAAEAARAEAARAEAARAEAARAEAARAEAARAEAARAEAARAEAARAEAARAEAARLERALAEAEAEAAVAGWGADFDEPSAAPGGPPGAGINPVRTARRSAPAPAVGPVPAAASARPASTPVRPPSAEVRIPRATPVPTATQPARTPAEIEAILRAGMAELDGVDAPQRPPSARPRIVAPAADTDFDALMREARRRQQAGDFSGSLELVEQVLAGQPEHAEARRYMEQNTTRLLAMYRSRLGRMSKVPTVKLRPQEIIWQALDHRAGFVLAQVDGLTNYEDIVEISGMSELEATRILARLVEHGVIG